MAPGPLRIGLDARAAAEVPAGRGRYVRELARALVESPEEISPLLLGREAWPLPGSRWRTFPTPDPLWAAHAALAAAGRCDVILAANSYLMAVAPVPVVVVVHDLFGAERSHGLPASALAERATLPLAVRRAAGFACPSEATRAALEARHPSTRGRSVVIPHGVERRFLEAEPAGVAASLGIETPFVLTVATLEPRKNLPRLVEAFAHTRAAREGGHRLALVGGAGWSRAELDGVLGRHGDLVRVLGFVPDEQLPSLYAEASAFAFPSLGEGFGLPLLEAMAAGAPVLTSDCSALPEVAGEAAVLVDPGDPSAIAAGLDSLLGDPALAARLARAGRERAAALTWERCARSTVTYLRSVTSTFAAGNSRESSVSS
jgi:alpha-1,3-rhamnosyl/mannosyltransferase